MCLLGTILGTPLLASNESAAQLQVRCLQGVVHSRCVCRDSQLSFRRYLHVWNCRSCLKTLWPALTATHTVEQQSASGCSLAMTPRQ